MSEASMLINNMCEFYGNLFGFFNLLFSTPVLTFLGITIVGSFIVNSIKGENSEYKYKLLCDIRKVGSELFDMPESEVIPFLESSKGVKFSSLNRYQLADEYFQLEKQLKIKRRKS